MSAEQLAIEELYIERERVEVLEHNIGNCMDTIAQQDKEIERLEDVVKVLCGLIAEEDIGGGIERVKHWYAPCSMNGKWELR